MASSQSATESDRQGFDRRFFADAEDLAVYRPTSTSDVADALTEIAYPSSGSAPAGHEVQITSGRHCYEGFVYNSDTKVVIDVTGLRDFGTTDEFGLDSDVVYIGTGYGNWDMYRIMNNVYGKTLPAGSCYSVGLGGHLTGGGYGILSRLYGLTVDYIYGFEVVVDAGGSVQTKTVTRDDTGSDGELYWALCGIGGGQIGVITRYFFVLDELPTSPNLMATISFSWSWFQKDGKTPITYDTFQGLITDFYNTYCDQSTTTWNVWAMFHATHISAGSLTMPVIIYNPFNSGVSRSEFTAATRDLVCSWTEKFSARVPLITDDHPIDGHPYLAQRSSLGIASPGMSDEDGPYYYSYLDGTQTLNGSGPNRHGKYKSAYHQRNLTNNMSLAMYNALTDTNVTTPNGNPVQLSNALVQMDSYGGQINQRSWSDTPIPQRRSSIKLQYQTYWTDAGYVPGQVDTDQEAGQLNWINAMYANVYKDTGGVPVLRTSTKYSDVVTDGCYFNYPDIYIGSRDADTPSVSQAWELYFGANVARLSAAALNWNPNGWFTNSQTFQYGA